MPQEPSHLDFGQLSAPQQQEVDAARNRFEREWESGASPRIRDYVDGQRDQSTAGILFRELLRIELERRRSAGSEPRLLEYLPEFSEHESIIHAEFTRVSQSASRDTNSQLPLGILSPQDSTFVAPGVPQSDRAADSGNRAVATTTSPGAPLAGRYQLASEIARGGMGVVYRANDLLFRREVAIKLLRPHWEQQTDPVLKRHQLAQAIEAFRYEAEITARLQHPGIPPVHELGTLAGGLPFLAMKLIQGRTLQTLLDGRQNPLADLPRWLQVFEQVAQAVGYAHSKGILHRDLKPLNVMVGEFGEVQVMDWGLAKNLGTQSVCSPPTSNSAAPSKIDSSVHRMYQSQPGDVKGTLAYMPPEQARGEIDKLDSRADVFGLGAILCHILTGQPPYGGDTSMRVQLSAAAGDLDAANQRLKACGVDAELIDLALRCLSPSPTDRPADGAAVAQAVAAYRVHVDLRLRQAETERARSEQRRVEQAKQRWLWYGISASFGLLLLYFAWSRHAIDVRERDALLLANNLANHESRAGNSKEALSLYERTLAIRRARLGVKDRNTIISMINLEKEYHKTGRFEQALALDQELLPLCQEILGKHDRHTLNTMNNLGSAYYQTKRFAEAIPHYEESLQLRQRHLGQTDPDTLDSLNNLANAYFEVGRFKEARDKFEEARKIRAAQDGPEHPATIHLVWSLANAEQKLKNWTVAEQHYLASYQAAEKFPAELKAQYQGDLLPEIVTFYQEWEKPAEVAKWQAEIRKRKPM